MADLRWRMLSVRSFIICLHRDVTAIVKDFLFNVCQLNDLIRHVPILVFLTLYLFLEARTVKYRFRKEI